GRARTNDGERCALDEAAEIDGVRGQRALGRLDAETTNGFELDQRVEDGAHHAFLASFLWDAVASMCSSRSVASLPIVANVCSTAASASVSVSLGSSSAASSDSGVSRRISWLCSTR